jgi:glycosyltransferase involved in cell wall biosynthesis
MTRSVKRRDGFGHDYKIAVVLPCYKSKEHVLGVISAVGPEVFLIIVVDDACPMGTGQHVAQNCSDSRVVIVHNEKNLGVGGAVIHGYRIALERGADVVVKVDSDGQMNPAHIMRLVHPIITNMADYTKGNRFFNIEDTQPMPAIRIFGNAGLSFLTKLSSGYWGVFDPTNGYTAIHRIVLAMLPLEKVDRRFFFESDLLFRLYCVGAVVIDVPMRAVYANEISNMRIGQIFGSFILKNLQNFSKRIFYRYFLRDVNLASLELCFGLLLFFFGSIFGLTNWVISAHTGTIASAGTVMLAALPVLAGLQLILGFFAYDISAVPKVPVQSLLGFSSNDDQ